jgi:hypothetical protein
MNKKAPSTKLQAPEKLQTLSSRESLPIIIDPFSRSGDEVAGNTPDEIALNLWACVSISRRYRQALHRSPPNLEELFRGYQLSSEAKAAIRKTETVFASSKSAPAPAAV